MINLTKDSWHRKFYEFWWARPVSDNLCNHFWGLVLAIVTSPFLIVGRIVYGYFKDDPYYGGPIWRTFTYLLNTFLIVWLSAVIGVIIGKAFYYPLIALAVFGGMCFIIGLGIVTYFFTESESYDMTVTAIKAKKDNVCPRINWN